MTEAWTEAPAGSDLCRGRTHAPRPTDIYVRQISDTVVTESTRAGPCSGPSCLWCAREDRSRYPQPRCTRQSHVDATPRAAHRRLKAYVLRILIHASFTPC